MEKSFSVKIGVAALIIAVIFLGYQLFAPLGKDGETIRVVIPLKGVERENSLEYAVQTLSEQGFMTSKWPLSFFLKIYGVNEIEPGAYVIAGGKSAYSITKEFLSPDEKWVVILEGLRKEEIAGILADTLGWSKEEEEKWVNEYTTINEDRIEGVYFPDTYLIPVHDSPEDVVERFSARFNEKFTPYADEFLKEDIKWTTALKLASLVQREAASKDDMPLIAGVLWNRLLNNMKLDVDATIQYARGDAGDGWWAPITKDDKNIDSPFNTYLYVGLPPHPIANPGIDAIEAILYPEETNCFFYLHGSDGQIHCASTYDEHMDNINKYLR